MDDDARDDDGEILEAERRRRARLRRLDRMKRRGLSLARGACVTCPVMALLWVFGLWLDVPNWAVALIGFGGLVGIGLLARLAQRGRTVREPTLS